ncbi:MAG: prenyltransferase/squalene oxidase repeat-containing protein [Candidatus Bathyarchaeia archaeon]
MREAGRFALREKATLDLKRIVDYVVNRQNDDGGYTFCQEAESNAQDTYYGLAILELLGSPFPHLEKTVRWLRELSLDSIYSYYYVGKALLMCGERLDDSFKKFIISAIRSISYFENGDIYVEVSSEFTTTLITLELANILKIEFDGNAIKNWLLQYRNRDCGFGARRHSNLASTYHAVASLSFLNHNMNDLHCAEEFVRQCEKPYGGFTMIPRSFAPYMEPTYYGVMTLDLLGKNCRFPSQTTDFILKCQRANGGFARSDLGISTFENTFQAVSVLRKLGMI